MFDLAYYNELCKISHFVSNSFEEAKAHGMFNRTYCHNLDMIDKKKLKAETTDIAAKVELWRMQGYAEYINWCASQHHFVGW